MARRIVDQSNSTSSDVLCFRQSRISGLSTISDGCRNKDEKELISPETISLINEDLKAVVTDENGTAHSLAALGLPLAAKTGTAEIKEKQDEKGQENSLFAFDAQNQKYLMVSMLEDRQENSSATALAPELLSYLSENYN